MNVNIFGQSYEAFPRRREKCDNFYSRGIIVDDIKFKSLYTHIAMVDGFKTGVILWRVIIIRIIVVILCLGLIGAGGYFAYTFKDEVSFDTKIDTGEREEKNPEKESVLDDTILLRYNAFMSYNNGKVDINLVNGDKESVVYLTGEGLECDLVELEPNEERQFIPIKLLTKDEVISAKLIYTYDNKSYEYIVSVENLSDTNIQEGADVTFETEEVIRE